MADASSNTIVSSLPTADERDWLIEQLAALTAAAGWVSLINAPLVEPDHRFFPDRWTPDAAGIRRMALRLLRYAGLDELDVDVALFTGDRERTFDARGTTSERHEGAAAWFAGIEDGICRFGAEAGGLEDPESLAGTMAHEVAHVFRRVHALEHDDSDLEERLTDITTIYLGFGVLTTNASLKHRSRGDFSHHAWSRQSAGYLPPQAMSFLLALLARTRGLDPAGLRYVAKLLETNQRAWFETSCSWLAKQRPDLRSELGVPDPDKWPDLPDLARLWAPIADKPELPTKPVKRAHRDAPVAALAFKPNSGRRVLRVHARRRIPMFLVILTGVFAVLLFASDNPIPAALLILAVFAISRTYKTDRCSDPDCRARMDEQTRECPGCGGLVSGVIASPDERLAVLEALERANPSPPPIPTTPPSNRKRRKR